MSKPSEWLELAQRAAHQAGTHMVARAQQPLSLQSKGFRDIVTEVDFESQAIITNLVRAEFPSHTFLTEEEDATLPEGGSIRWIIDPIDGTSNYSRGIPIFCVSIAVAIDDELQLGVVYDPTREEMFSAVRGAGFTVNEVPRACSTIEQLSDALLGIEFSRTAVERQYMMNVVSQIGHEVRSLRVMGSAAMALAAVAAGRLDGYVNFTLGPWDWAAGKLLVEEAGGQIDILSDEGQPFPATAIAIAAADSIFMPLREKILTSAGHDVIAER